MSEIKSLSGETHIAMGENRFGKRSLSECEAGAGGEQSVSNSNYHHLTSVATLLNDHREERRRVMGDYFSIMRKLGVWEAEKKRLKTRYDILCSINDKIYTYMENCSDKGEKPACRDRDRSDHVSDSNGENCEEAQIFAHVRMDNDDETYCRMCMYEIDDAQRRGDLLNEIGEPDPTPTTKRGQPESISNSSHKVNGVDKSDCRTPTFSRSFHQPGLFEGGVGGSSDGIHRPGQGKLFGGALYKPAHPL